MAGNTMIFEPLQNLLQGVVQGHQIHQAIQQQALQQEVLARQQFQQDREFKLQEAQQNFQHGQVESSLAEQILGLGGREATPDDLAEATTGYKVNTPGMIAAPSDLKTRLIKSPAGKQYVIPSQDELLARRIKESTAIGQAQNNNAIDLKTREENIPIDLGGEYGKVPKAQIPVVVAGINNKRISDEGKLTRDATAANNKATNDSRERAAKLRVMAGAGTPQENATVAQGIANYKIAPPTLTRSPQSRAIMSEVLKLNPDFNAQHYQTAQKTENAFTSGKPADNVNALNTALGHLGHLHGAAEALKNGNIRLLNGIANYFDVEAGKDPVTTYKTIVHRVGPELVKAYVGAGGGVEERGLAEADFDPKNGPDQLQSNISISAKLLGSKLDALQHQYNQGTRGRGDLQLITPEAQGTMDRLVKKAPSGAAFTVTVPGGKSYNFPTQEAADKFKKDAKLQ